MLKGRPLREGGMALYISEKTLQQCARGVNEEALGRAHFWSNFARTKADARAALRAP